ncbi:sensor domain-containing protein [Marinobacterium sediminicola]|uniref:PAS domain S-box-containing protein/diguanylate cyclase (GGDEF) domain-containing protein n=1 Tax=Marinobacterium sediminicola TaxID=518898 RepID=A0ABY1RW77_9GAMM|nr:EAL domain-containing protein [Marinobacterium sediminicola]ULG70410.1 EAL domain-containing protein [Marinobacterium sediminicola]SMR69432.1 PAS domain S-box-containing protein/diguanylate cyclase (GGDEF) domain-containing protein [Marinobacterium sediminicola]
MYSERSSPLQFSRLWVLVLQLFVLVQPITAEADIETARGPSFAQVFSDSDLPMLLIEPASGEIVKVNDAAANFYGYPVEQLTGMRIQQINTFTAEQVAAERAMAESEGRNFFIFRHRLADGEIRTVEVYSRPYRFEGKSLLYSIISDITPGRHQAADLWHYQQTLEEMVDAQVSQIESGRRWQLWTLIGATLAQALVITFLVININQRRELEKQRKATNKALQESRFQLEEAQRIARLGSWQLDQSTGLISCSPEMCQMLEMQDGREKFSYESIMKTIHPDDLDVVRERYREAIARQVPYELEHRLLMPDGRIKHVRVRVESRSPEKGDDSITVGIVQDVTEQHVVQAALTALANEYALLSGEDFYRAVCQHLLDALALDYVFVGQLCNGNEAVNVITGCSASGRLQPFRYALQGTPCSNVLEAFHSVHPEGVACAYPDDKLLADMGIESYIGSSLLDKQQQPMGILVGMGCNALQQQELARGLLNVFVESVSAEMQRSAAEKRIEMIDAYREIMLKFSNRFINLSLPKVDSAIQDALHEIGEFIGADSCYLFSYDLAAGTASMSHEWCVEGMLPEQGVLQELPLDQFPGWIEKHRQGLPIIVEDTENLQEKFVADILRRRKIQCLVDLPLMSHGECLGFVGVASQRQTNLFTSQTVDLLSLFAGLLTNIRQRQQVEGQLRLSASVFDNTDESIIITDADGRIISVNKAFTYTTGYTLEEVFGLDPIFMNEQQAEPGYRERLWEHLRHFGHWKGEVWNRDREGERYAVLQKINAFFDNKDRLQGYVSLMSDITTLKQHQRQLERIAHFDGLTGLPNRTLLADRLQQAMVMSQRHHSNIAILFIDLDGFKAINDSFSHAVGDKLLVKVAQRMKQLIRQEDTLARLGGDEFVAVLVDLEQNESSLPVIRRLLETVAEPVRIDGLELKVSASIGVSFYPQHDSLDADQLLRQADQAMYQSKQAGKNRYHLFDVERDRALRTQHDSLARVQAALQQNELVLHYQPKVNMRTGELVGCEALIRWQHPERGLLMPAAFLPVIENQLLAVDVGNWVVETALDQVLAWKSQGMAVPVSVNIDAIHLQQPSFVQDLAHMLERRPKIQPGDLELEILETTALEDVDQVSMIINRCEELGVGFALDDFGTGYSSLTYLKRLPAQLLKIDRSFVRDMLEDPDDLAILNGVIQLASAFRREVIAEGVETEQHCRELLALGCELGQGFAIARPMPASDLPDWLESWHQRHKGPLS